MPRDNFSKKVIERLKARVNHRCSNAECRVQTSAPSEESSESVSSIGVAAHICAASPQGPRYDGCMSPTKRKSINNAIWLCNNCSVKIDRDIKKYPVKLLHEWKFHAENTTSKEQGEKPPTHEDATNTLTQILSGSPKSFIANAISTAHSASEQALENLDPRFKIKTTYRDNTTIFGIHAKKPVSIKLGVLPSYKQEFKEKYKNLFEHGSDLDIDASAIVFDGSKLFDEISSSIKDGKFSLRKNKVKATQKLWVKDRNSKITETFDDIHGDIAFGLKSLSFEGSCCNDIFSLNYQNPFSNTKKATMSMGVDTSKWEGLDIRQLPYFDKISGLFEKLNEGWQLFTSVEINGMVLYESNGIDVKSWSFVVYTYNFLSYIKRTKIIAEYLQKPVHYMNSIEFSTEEHKLLAEIVDRIEGKFKYDTNSLESNVTCNLRIDEDRKNLGYLLEARDPFTIKFIQEEGDAIKLFGIDVQLPNVIVYLSHVLPKILNKNDELKGGELAEIEWVAQKGFNCLVSYEDPNKFIKRDKLTQR